MDERRIFLYRELLYWAMCDMKAHSAVRGFRFLLWGKHSYKKRLQFVESMNRWLHNVAMCSTSDFQELNEEWFWSGYQEFRQKFPADQWAPFTEEIIKQLRVQK